ncbi:division/cell wall cluster transcriptional repressor MraZ [soil metagenome]
MEAPEGAPTAPTLPAYGHPPFRGTFRTKLEPSGRVALPAALRGAFGGTGVLRATRQHLTLCTPLAFDEIVKAFQASQPGGVVAPRTRKRFHMSSTDVLIDRQHRFVIPPEFKTQVGLGDQIVLAGAIEAIEIWSAAAFRVEEAAFDDVDLFFDGFEGL